MEPQERPRVPLLPTYEAREIGKSYGVPSSMTHLNVFRCLLHHPKLASSVAGTLSGLLWRFNALDEKLRELIIMRIGWRTRATYEWTQHWQVALRVGLTDDEILAVRDWRRSEILSKAARAVLAATDDTLDHGHILDDTWAKCCSHLKTEAQRIELVLAIANWRSFSELLQSLKIPLEEGVVPWPPDGKICETLTGRE